MIINNCIWKKSRGYGYEDWSWETKCDNAFEFNDGGNPDDHHFNFCPYCGKPITFVETDNR